MNKATLNDISNVPLSEIAMNLEYKTLLNFCKTNKKFSNFCKKDGFWKLKLKHDYPDFNDIYEDSLTYREKYDSLYYRDKHIFGEFSIGDYSLKIVVEYININIYNKTLENIYKESLYNKITQSSMIYRKRREETYPEDVLINREIPTYDALYEYYGNKDIHAYSIEGKDIDDTLTFESENIPVITNIGYVKEYNQNKIPYLIVGKNELNEPIIEIVDIIISRAIETSEIGILYQFPELELHDPMIELLQFYFEYMLTNNADNRYDTFIYWCMQYPRYIFCDGHSADLFFYYGYYNFLYLLAEQNIYISKNYFSSYILGCQSAECLDDNELIIKQLNKFAKKGDLDRLKYIYHIYRLLPDENGIQFAKNNNHTKVLNWLKNL